MKSRLPMGRCLARVCGITFLAVFATIAAMAEEVERIHSRELRECCHGFEKFTLGDREYTLAEPEGEMISLVRNILSYTGLEPNFVVRRLDGCDNAFATIRENKRYLIYDSKMLRRWALAQGEDWTVLGILANEIGHHVQGHTSVRQEDSHKQELEADRYGGWVQGLMGAELAEAQQFAKNLPEEDSATHPGRPKRLVAIQEGWDKAQRTRVKISRPKVAGARCPVVHLEDPDLVKETFVGMVGGDPGQCTLGVHVDGSVRGLFEPQKLSEKGAWKLIGKLNAQGSLELEQYEGCEIVGTWALKSWQDEEEKGWSGSKVSAGGKQSPVVLTFAKARVTPEGWKPEYTPIPAPKPEPKPKGPVRYISAIGGFPEAWFCTMSEGTGYTRQAVACEEAFPLPWIRDRWNEGFHITHLAGDGDQWACVMSKGSSLTRQVILGPGPLPETQYAIYRDQGYRITAVAGYQDTWVFVMSLGSGLGVQSFSKPGPWPVDLIRKRWDAGYRITGVAGDSHNDGDSLLVVLSLDSGIGAQSYSDGGGFPSALVNDYRSKGYSVTAASGYTGWRVVLSQNSNSRSRQWFTETWVSKTFPMDFIKGGWSGE